MHRTSIAAAAIAAVLPLAALAVPRASTAAAASSSTTTGADQRRVPAPAVEIEATINRRELTAGEFVKVRGRVTPKAAGQKVILQQRLSGQRRWRESGVAKVKPTGRVVVLDQASTPGHRSYRLLMPATEAFGRSVSNEVWTAVWGWRSLTLSYAEGARSGVDTDVAPVISTNMRPSSIVLTSSGTTGFVEYTVGRECRALMGTYALTDESETGATGTVTVTVDGRPVVTHGMGTGTIQEFHTVDITNAFRIRFDLEASATPAGRAAVASPSVLCLD